MYESSQHDTAIDKFTAPNVQRIVKKFRMEYENWIPFNKCQDCASSFMTFGRQ
jgi:hypothetical protein